MMIALPPGYSLSDRHEDMQIDAIHNYLRASYWARDIPLDVMRRAIAGSLCVGLFHHGQQIGFARTVTDRATFAYLGDVYVLDGHGGQGLAKAMVTHLQAHPDLQGLRRWMLATRDAHDLYRALGWTAVDDPARLMQRHFPAIYA